MEGKILVLNLDMVFEILIQLANTFILIFVLSKFLYNPVVKILNKRQEKISNDIKETNKNNEKAKLLKDEYEEKLNSIKKEADVILEEARKKALDSEAIIMKEARDESDLLKKKTQSDIEKFKEQVRDEIRQETIEVATVMARKIIAETLDDNRKKEILDETIKEMENLKWLA